MRYFHLYLFGCCLPIALFYLLAATGCSSRGEIRAVGEIDKYNRLYEFPLVLPKRTTTWRITFGRPGVQEHVRHDTIIIWITNTGSSELLYTKEGGGRVDLPLDTRVQLFQGTVGQFWNDIGSIKVFSFSDTELRFTLEVTIQNQSEDRLEAVPVRAEFSDV